MSESPIRNPAVPDPSGLAAFGCWRERTAGVLAWTLVAIAATVLAGSLLLASVPAPPRVIARAVKAGQAPAGLRHLVDALCLGYRWPTLTGTEIKSLPLGLGLAGVAVVVAAAWVLRGIGARRPANQPETPSRLRRDRFGADRHVQWLARVELVDVAQGLLALVILWSVVSRAWSPAPDLSIRATGIVAVQAGWALLLSRGLALLGRSGPAVRTITIALVLSCFGATALALRFHGLEGWFAGSFFPVGRARLFAACAIPAVVLTAAWMVGPAMKVWRDSAAMGMARWVTHVVSLVALAAVLVVLGWGIGSSGSRAAWVGCGIGLIGLVWFSVRRRDKVIVGVIGVVALVAVAVWLVRFAQTSGSLASADVRLCGYGWRYALRTWAWSRGTGIGQAGFTISAEPRLVADLFDDPSALGTRWQGHAQNEWLEVLCDLGLVGFHLTVGVYLLTLMAGVAALRRMGPGPLRRCLIGLMAAMAGMAVEECMGCGLRYEPLPALWYTVLGGIWAILLSLRPGVPSFTLTWRVRAAGVAALVLVGAGAGVFTWRAFLGEHGLASAAQRTRTRRATETIDMVRRATRDILRPRHQARARLIGARAHLVLAGETMARMVRQSSQAISAAKTGVAGEGGVTSRAAPASRPVEALWMDPLFRATWDRAERHLHSALRLLADLQARLPAYPGRAALEADVCRVLVEMWQLAAGLAGPQGSPAVRQATDNARGYRRRRVTALRDAIDRQPFNDALLVMLLRTDSGLPLSRVVDLLRRPLRNPLLSEDYRGVILQVASDKEFKEAFRPFVERATQDASGAVNHEWTDAASPETLRMAAIVLAVQGKTSEAIDSLNHSLRLYAGRHHRLSVQQALAMADLGWLRLVAQPERPDIALGVLRRALAVSDRPSLHPSLRPIYRRMMHAVLAAGDEATAGQLAWVVSPAASPRDSNALLAWSYEVLGRAFHQLDPDRRPAKWRAWVERAAELDPNSPDIQVLVALMACEEGDDARAAASLERAWRGSTSFQQSQECVRTLLYALRRNPDSRPLGRLRRRIGRQIRAATQPGAAGSLAPGGTTPAPGFARPPGTPLPRATQTSRQAGRLPVVGTGD